MQWFAVYSAALAMAAGSIHVASAQAQPVPQAPAGNAVPVTADNFNRGYSGELARRVCDSRRLAPAGLRFG
jgi:hypothetical protein